MFGILEAVPDDKKAEEEQMLKEVEAEIEAQNEAFANGEATFQEKLTIHLDLGEYARPLEHLQPAPFENGVCLPPHLSCWSGAESPLSCHSGVFS